MTAALLGRLIERYIFVEGSAFNGNPEPWHAKLHTELITNMKLEFAHKLANSD